MMKFERLHLVYFSPTGSTQRVLNRIAQQFSQEPRAFDITESNAALPQFYSDDFVLIGIPVYSGRVPETALERFENLRGDNTPAALVVTYGNRDYDDALLELKTVVEEKGFHVIAGAAFISEHSIARKIATGRPNDSDIAVIESYGRRIVEKIGSIENLSDVDLKVKGNPVYREYKTLPIRPRGDSSCTGCGECAKHCPTKAISSGQPRKTDKDLCICCMRCVQICPRHARKISAPELWAAEKMILGQCSGDKQPEIFI